MTYYSTGKAYVLDTRHRQGLILMLFFVLILATSLVLQWIVHRCSLILTPDSLNYLAASKSFRDTSQFLDSSWQTYFLWPPLFPVILSFFDDPQRALSVIHVLMRLVISCYIFYLAQRTLTHPVLKITLMMVTIAGVHLMMISVFLWSEMIFVFLALTTLFFSFCSDHSNKFFILLLITGFFLCLQRNAGIFWMTGICIWLFLNREISLTAKLLKSISCFVISTSGFWCWNFYHSYFSSADVRLFNNDFFSTFLDNTYVVLISMGRLALPVNGLFAAILALLLIAASVILLKEQINNDRLLQLMVVIVMMYTIGYLSLNTLDKNEIDRYFSPITTLFCLIGFMAVEKIYAKAKEKMQLIILALIVLWTAYPLARTINNINLWQNMSCHSQTSILIQSCLNPVPEFKKA